MAQVRSLELDSTLISSIQESLKPDLSIPHQRGFENLFHKYQTSQDSLAALIRDRQAALLPAMTQVAMVGNYLYSGGKKIEEISDFVAPHSGEDLVRCRSEVILGRIRYQFSNPDLKPPFPFSLLKPYFRRWALPAHPLMQPLLEQQALGWVALASAAENMAGQAAEKELEFGLKIEMAGQAIKGAEKRFWDFCDRVAASSEETAKRYLQVAPERLTEVIKGFVNLHLADRRYQKALEIFVLQAIAEAKSTLTHPNRRHFYGLLGEELPPITYATLPPVLQNRWRTHLEQQVFQEWQK